MIPTDCYIGRLFQREPYYGLWRKNARDEMVAGCLALAGLRVPVMEDKKGGDFAEGDSLKSSGDWKEGFKNLDFQ